MLDIQFKFETKSISFNEGMLLVPFEESGEPSRLSAMTTCTSAKTPLDDASAKSHNLMTVAPELSNSTISEQTWLQ